MRSDLVEVELDPRLAASPRRSIVRDDDEDEDEDDDDDDDEDEDEGEDGGDGDDDEDEEPDDDDDGAEDVSDNFGGGSSQQYTGIIYAPKSIMNYSGNASSSAYTILVSYRLNMVGTSTINNDYSSLPTGNPIKITALVE